MHKTKYRCDCGHEFWHRTMMADDWIVCPSCGDDERVADYGIIESGWQHSDGAIRRRPEQ